ncbi:MAG: hypothetical protein KDE57_12990 [Calditrichaeota bacterium]|nr:hypothetical protein [Calditrichota bacterium]
MKYFLTQRDGYYDFCLDNGTTDENGNPQIILEMQAKPLSASGLHILQCMVNTMNFLIGVENKKPFWRPQRR